jgi:hypothetical protein
MASGITTSNLEMREKKTLFDCGFIYIKIYPYAKHTKNYADFYASLQWWGGARHIYQLAKLPR